MIYQNENGDKAVAMAIADPMRYVLKPQREGGGNNIYDEKVRSALETMKGSQERTAWILMDRITPPIQKNYLIRPNTVGATVLQDLVSELGIYGVIIGYALDSFYFTLTDTYYSSQKLDSVRIVNTSRWDKIKIKKSCILKMTRTLILHNNDAEKLLSKSNK